ncbi:MAG TPA: hypothetical protein VGN72_05410 [Tepidisphaeraceae bacterium]|jgi:hypothetical protein|nr:hypothetical protein [Tepidisphaeraceae bacterium]
MTLLNEIPLDIASTAGQYWTASERRPWIRDMSHWRGQGRWASDDAWQSIGLQHLAMVRKMMRLAGVSTPLRTMMEWGPGGGANAVAFAPWLERFIGVDISLPNLQECGRQLTAAAFGGFQPVHIPAIDPAAVLEKVTEPLDLFLSTAVFQHFPSQAYGVQVLNLARQMIKPYGLALVQIRYDDGSKEMRCKSGEYNDQSAVTFTSYRIDQFWSIVEQAGFEPLSVTLQPESLYAYYALRAA